MSEYAVTYRSGRTENLSFRDPIKGLAYLNQAQRIGAIVDFKQIGDIEKKPEDEETQFGLRIDHGRLSKLRSAADRKGLSMAQFIRDWIDSFD